MCMNTSFSSSSDSTQRSILKVKTVVESVGSSRLSDGDVSRSTPLHRSPSSDSLSSSSKSISFGKVDIREYEQVIGDNPSCSSGAPISLGWEYDPGTSFDIDEYESSRVDTRRTKYEMIIPANIRRQTLEGYGYSIRSIVQASNEAKKVQEMRVTTAQQQIRRTQFVGSVKKVFGRK